MNEIIQKEKAVVPAMKAEQAVEAWNLYQSLKKKLKGDGDFVKFWTSQGERDCPTKIWRGKLRRFFGLNIEIIEKWDVTEINHTRSYHRIAKVSDPISGTFATAEGVCNTNEKIRTLEQIIYSIEQTAQKKWEKKGKKGKRWWEDITFVRKFAEQKQREEIAKAPHNAATHAETRAKNRATFEFVGFGEVSAEEMPVEEKIEEGEYEIEEKNKIQEVPAEEKIPEDTEPEPATAKQKGKIQQLAGKLGYKTLRKKPVDEVIETLTKQEASKIIAWLMQKEKEIASKSTQDKKLEKLITQLGEMVDRGEIDAGYYEEVIGKREYKTTIEEKEALVKELQLVLE